MRKLPICPDDIRAAQACIRGVARRTPVLTSEEANSRTGAELFFKCENFQRVGAFKFRGAYHAIACLSPEERAAGVVTFSSGNHGQAIALSARLQGVESVIVMPTDAPGVKVAGTRNYGADIVFYDRYKDDREALGRQIVHERRMTLIPPYDHPHVMAGQGTAALELVEDVGELDVLLVPVGGGGLISGCAVAVRAMLPKCLVVGVEPEAGNDVQRSLRRGEIVAIDVPQTIADGAQTQRAGNFTFPVIRELVGDILTVDDGTLIDAMIFFAQNMKMVVEPTGCLGAAAAFDRRLDIRGKRVGVIISGGNIDLDRFCRLTRAGDRRRSPGSPGQAA